jgi:16S rRNA (uracil1498-N3)-methyltransferase
MALHRIFTEDPLPGDAADLVITGDEAHHALRVKRLTPGDAVQVLDGRGRIAEAAVTGSSKQGREWVLHVQLRKVMDVHPVQPRVEVFSPAPKGPRLTDMIEGLSQVGAAAWSLLETARSISEPRAARLDRLERTAAEASKQCGRAWRLEIGSGRDLQPLLASGTVVADASGAPYAHSGRDLIRLLIGPEGGWTEDELVAAQRAGASITRFGPHTMRIETAAVASCAIILATEAAVR